MKAVVIPEKNIVEVTTVDDPAPDDRQVVVEVAGCGICGTDLHILEGEFAPTLPVVPGHEFAGEVVAVGADVPADKVRVGDQVAVDPSLHCGECYYCRRGRGNLCENWAAIGVTAAGGAAEYAVAPAKNCFRLPRRGQAGRRGADRAAVLRRTRVRRAAPPARRPLPHLRRRHHGPDDDG